MTPATSFELRDPCDDEVLVAVGRDISEDELVGLVVLRVMGTSILLGPRNALMLGQALAEAGAAVLAAERHGSLAVN